MLATNDEDEMEELPSKGQQHSDSNDHSWSMSNETPVHHLILEQQDEKVIEVSSRSRRNSFFSARSQVYIQKQRQHNVASTLRLISQVSDWLACQMTGGPMKAVIRCCGLLLANSRVWVR